MTGGTLLSIEYDSEGSAFCFFENLTLIDGEIGLNIDGGAATFSNRGTGTGILIHGCDIGLYMEAAQTWVLSYATQDCVVGTLLGTLADNNVFTLFSEYDDDPILLHEDCNNNTFFGLSGWFTVRFVGRETSRSSPGLVPALALTRSYSPGRCSVPRTYEGDLEFGESFEPSASHYIRPTAGSRASHSVAGA